LIGIKQSSAATRAPLVARSPARHSYVEGGTALAADDWRRRMTSPIVLDVRGLEAPEPLVRVLETLDRLPPGGSVLVKIDCHPKPLFRILERNGYVHEERPGSESLLEIDIRKG
jgi:TusA-related sulfurtransferase